MVLRNPLHVPDGRLASGFVDNGEFAVQMVAQQPKKSLSIIEFDPET